MQTCAGTLTNGCRNERAFAIPITDRRQIAIGFLAADFFVFLYYNVSCSPAVSSAFGIAPVAGIFLR